MHIVGHSFPQKATKAPKALTFMCPWKFPISYIITQARAMTKAG